MGSKEEIEKMVSDAEKYKAEDEKNKERIEARNSLENFAYTMRNTVSDEKAKTVLSDDEKKMVDDAAKKTIDWLGQTQDAEKTEYEKRLKELENICNPIVSKLYSGTSDTGYPNMSNARGQYSNKGPTIEEVD